MENKGPLYWCDPEKNVNCPKTGCKSNPAAVWQMCDATSHPEFAKLDRDGNPMECDDPEYLEWRREISAANSGTDEGKEESL